jgi:hypothetical protein
MPSAKFLFALLLLSVATLSAAESARPVAKAARAAVPPRIDGKLSEAEWMTAPVTNSFTQRDPREGTVATHPTAVRILYDDDAIYVGARIDNADAINFRLGRRDMDASSSDWFRIALDTFRDRRTAMRFEVNPGGVKRDAIITGNYFEGSFSGNDGELAWDAVWDAATSVDDKGWTAEMRIPFSQLRFAKVDAPVAGIENGEGGVEFGAEQTWGVQFETVNLARQELAMFAYTPKSSYGGVSAFGDLEGLRTVPSSHSLELMPFVLGRAAFAADDSHPLKPSRDYEFQGGIDARYKITSNLTLTAALNPDFGQVEVDPAVINLTAFETRLEEKRPFFVEGAGNFRLATSLRSFYAARELLYTRRIGRAPQVALPSTVTDVPASTDILAAAKVTGRTQGWTVGVLNAFTDEMHGTYLDGSGVRRSAVVEPYTNYFVGRLGRELRSGQTALGIIGTAVNRDLGDPRAAAALSKSAYTGGFDFGHDFFKRVWNISGYLLGSRVDGTPAAMTALQRNSSRYFQRPDAKSFRLDPGATSLSGMAGQFQFGKRVGRHWDGNMAYLFVDPDYEINDVGFFQRMDRRGLSGRLTYTERTPGRFLRQSVTNFYYAYYQNYDGDWLDKQTRVLTVLQHRNYWTMDIDAEYMPSRSDDRLTRGGPVAEKPGHHSLLVRVTSDSRKLINASVAATMRREDSGTRTDNVTASLELQGSKRWSLSVGPRVDWARQEAQYVTSVADPLATSTFGRRYVFARLHQNEASFETRLNYAFNANLTLELYAQPLVANGKYGTPKEFLAPRTFRFGTYGTDLGTLERTGRSYRIDPDGAGPAAPFTANDLSFTSRSLRVNAVLRWEFRPGSTIYAVWQQERLNPLLMENFSLGRATTSVFDADSRNVFALKMSYWFNP